jgi:hypothetical protein
MNEQRVLRIIVEEYETLDVAINRLLDMDNLKPFGLPKHQVSHIEQIATLNAYLAYVLIRLIPATMPSKRTKPNRKGKAKRED